ncbi:MAG: hypothetical protein GWO41_04175 [candidate division Zixibacteria bacterium]|nr:hypothetical protein [candidate division Zixibacteria bacterium]NIR64095.1 hypothetical protein [candidate division Zixibacteria bacterium]NIS15424.1 hypothetical protein [candidate division Zixibacteria bacterium]NIS45993.1 hypothetical protein [candidate division Zixibacteria bacterium]NIT51952.1 hypothetical protein [candidate division Zixibacteria bacterium]
MRSKGVFTLGIFLICIALAFFIYVFEAKTILSGIPSELVSSTGFKYAGYIAAILGMTFLFAGLFKTRSLVAEYDKLRRSLGKSSDSAGDEFRDSIPVVSFQCLNCKKRINAEFLKGNDSIECPHCNVRNMIPESAIRSIAHVMLRNRKGKIVAAPNKSNDSNGFAISFLNLMAWINLILLSAAGIYLILKGTPSNISYNVYLGGIIIYAGLIFTALMFGVVWLSFNQYNKSQSQE